MQGNNILHFCKLQSPAGDRLRSTESEVALYLAPNIGPNSAETGKWEEPKKAEDAAHPS